MASVFHYPARCALYDLSDVVLLARFAFLSRVCCFCRVWCDVLVEIDCQLHLIWVAIVCNLNLIYCEHFC